MLQWQNTISIQLRTKALDQKLDMGVLRQILLRSNQQFGVTLLLYLDRCRVRGSPHLNLDLHRLLQMTGEPIHQCGDSFVRDQMPMLRRQGQQPAVPLDLSTGL